MKRSIKKYISVLLYITIALILAIGAMFLILELSKLELTRYEKIKDAFSKVDTMILEVEKLHDLYHNNEEKIQEIPEYAETLSRLSNELKKLEKLSTQTPVFFSSDEMPSLITTQHQYLQFATVLKDLQRGIESWTYNKIQFINKLENVALNVILIGLGVIVVVLLFVWKSFKDYAEYIQRSVGNINLFLEHGELKTQPKSN